MSDALRQSLLRVLQAADKEADRYEAAGDEEDADRLNDDIAAIATLFNLDLADPS